MQSVFRFDLLNYRLREPIEIDPQYPDFPNAERLILSQRQQEPEEPLGLEETPQAREASAFVEVDCDQNEIVCQKRVQDFMDTVCWLLSLAELRHVYYWGSHRYTSESSTWKWRSSAWKDTYVKDWSPLRSGHSSGVFQGTVIPWRLPHFLPRALRILSEPNFARQDFVLALHAFLDSLPLDQLPEIRFIKKWIALEKLINERCETNESLYIFGKRNSCKFSTLKDALREFISKHPSVTSTPGSEDSLNHQLSALERVPIKTLAATFLNDLGIQYNVRDIEDIVNTRSSILHYLEKGRATKEVWELDKILCSLLSKILCRMVGWDFEKELKEEYVTPHGSILPDYVKLTVPKPCFKAEGVGTLETEDKSRAFQCNGIVEWNRDSIAGKLATTDADPLEVHKIVNDFEPVTLQLEVDDGTTLFLNNARIDHVKISFSRKGSEGLSQDIPIPFNVVATEILRQRRNE